MKALQRLNTIYFLTGYLGFLTTWILSLIATILGKPTLGAAAGRTKAVLRLLSPHYCFAQGLYDISNTAPGSGVCRLAVAAGSLGHAGFAAGNLFLGRCRCSCKMILQDHARRKLSSVDEPFTVATSSAYVSQEGVLTGQVAVPPGRHACHCQSAKAEPINTIYHGFHNKAIVAGSTEVSLRSIPQLPHAQPHDPAAIHHLPCDVAACCYRCPAYPRLSTRPVHPLHLLRAGQCSGTSAGPDAGLRCCSCAVGRGGHADLAQGMGRHAACWST